MFTVLILHMLHGGVSSFWFYFGRWLLGKYLVVAERMHVGWCDFVIIHLSFPGRSFQRIPIALEGVQAVHLALLAAFSN
jgi:hypothetical protein